MSIELSDLAQLAMPKSDDDYGSERQVEAENTFLANAKNVIDAKAWEEFERWALKATSEERIQEALRLTAAKPARA